MNKTKKIGCVGLIIGGLLAAIGAIGSMISAQNDDESMFAMAVMSRVGAIIAFVAAIVVVAGVFSMANSKKGGAITSMFFGVLAFVGQFLINASTSQNAFNNALRNILNSNRGMPISVGIERVALPIGIGRIFLLISGVVMVIMGIVGLASKDKTHMGSMYPQMQQPMQSQMQQPIQPQIQQPMQQASQSVADELKKLKELLDIGVITQQEFDDKKHQLLNQ